MSCSIDRNMSCSVIYFFNHFQNMTGISHGFKLHRLKIDLFNFFKPIYTNAIIYIFNYLKKLKRCCSS